MRTEIYEISSVYAIADGDKSNKQVAEDFDVPGKLIIKNDVDISKYANGYITSGQKLPVRYGI